MAVAPLAQFLARQILILANGAVLAHNGPLHLSVRAWCAVVAAFATCCAFCPFSADEPDPLPLTGRAGKKWRLKEDDAITASAMFVLPSKKAGGRQEFGGPRRITRRITMNRRNIGFEDAVANEEGAKTPGEKKEKKRKKDKDDKGDKKSSKKSKK